MKADVTTLDAGKAGSVELLDEVFALEPRADILHRMVSYQLAKRQAGTHKTKGRSEIAATGKKFVRQKGSGGARHGDRKAPQFRGGGKAFGPVVRSHTIDLPKKVRALALRHALSSKAKSDNLVIIDEAKLTEPKTKAAKEAFAKLGLSNALIIDGAELDSNFAKAASNIPNVDVLPVQGINVYDILRREKLVLTKAAVESLEARFK
ncbi:50S ribosomal protein L4 [Parvibaculum sp.]|uniref:50S ribosomal protein L4 n=1 Tax=Parvibaculum sp. TaxID=2024848 RepID=UPI000C9889D3|nr:50S ribosomal protein L4 [Parvibaculum sp.]MAB14428.1 50S ribosomal protein L4 [Parvibaculum sp.]